MGVWQWKVAGGKLNCQTGLSNSSFDKETIPEMDVRMDDFNNYMRKNHKISVVT